MSYSMRTLNGDFGALLEGVTRENLKDQDFRSRAYDLWMKHGGLMAVRGKGLADLPPEELMAWAEVFGDIEPETPAARKGKMVPGYPILRIGNIRDDDGNRLAQFAKVPRLESDDDIRYNPEIRRPVWHTDSTFRQNPPIGSVFHCKQCPPQGAETLFANTRGAFEGLDAETKAKLEPLEAVCSLAHHDKKINLYTPDYPVLTPELRAANPPNRVPIVLRHPVTGQPALYGLNSSTCAILPKGKEMPQDQLDTCDLEGIEDESVLIWRDLLPYVTGPDFTVKWRWQAGDVVVWDNRCTLHAATGFDDETYQREMWRLTLLDRKTAAAAAE